jgi:ribosomal protein L21E
MKHVLRIALSLAIAAVLIVVGVGTVTAQTPSPMLVVQGIITARNDPPNTVSITSKDGSLVVLNVTPSTMITKAGIGKATLGDLATDDRAVAIYNKDTMIARKISAGPPLKKYHSFVGNITSVSDNSLVVTTRNGTVTIAVNSETKCKVPGVANATLENFDVGDRVAILAVEVTTVSAVENVALHVILIPGRPIYIHRVGTIESYQAGASITLKDRKGESSTFIVTGDTKIIFKKGATNNTEPKVGDRATVIARRDPAVEQFTATAIIDFGFKE